MERTDLASLAAEISLLWATGHWEPERIRAAEPLLLDLDARTVLAAVRQLAAEGREFAPPPGVVRQRAVELATQIAGDGPPQVDVALAEVYAKLATVGRLRTPEWSHPAIGAAIAAMGGWYAACMSDNPETWRAQFVKVYGVGAERSERAAVMPPEVRELVGGLDLRADRALGPER